MSKDYFSSQALSYRKFRPAYPPALFDYLRSRLSDNPLIWDCATGNGQAATVWSTRGARVIGSDISSNQLLQAPSAVDVLYIQARAEAVPLAAKSVDLVTVAQALHWFDFDTFYGEVKRVLKPGGLIAAWTYSFLSVSEQLGEDIDAAVRQFYSEVIGPYWPPERRWVDEQYRSIPFPFTSVTAPPFVIDVQWRLVDLVGYLSSWSAVALYRQARGHDPIAAVAGQLADLWGDPEEARKFKWPIDVRLGSCLATLD